MTSAALADLLPLNKTLSSVAPLDCVPRVEVVVASVGFSSKVDVALPFTGVEPVFDTVSPLAAPSNGDAINLLPPEDLLDVASRLFLRLVVTPIAFSTLVDALAGGEVMVTNSAAARVCAAALCRLMALAVVTTPLTWPSRAISEMVLYEDCRIASLSFWEVAKRLSSCRAACEEALGIREEETAPDDSSWLGSFSRDADHLFMKDEEAEVLVFSGTIGPFSFGSMFSSEDGYRATCFRLLVVTVVDGAVDVAVMDVCCGLDVRLDASEVVVR